MKFGIAFLGPGTDCPGAGPMGRDFPRQGAASQVIRRGTPVQRRTFASKEQLVSGLTLILHAIISTVLMGVGMVTLLTLGYVSAPALIAAILAGLVLGWPVARLIAKKLHEE